MLLPFLDAREVRICPVVTRQICLPKAAFLLTRLPFGSWMLASDHSWLASPSARAANHTSSRRNTSLRIADTSCDEKISCAPFLLTSGSLNSRITYRRSFECSLASSSSTTTVPPRSPSDSRTPLATSRRFRRPNRPETPRRHAGQVHLDDGLLDRGLAPFVALDDGGGEPHPLSLSILSVTRPDVVVKPRS